MRKRKGARPVPRPLDFDRQDALDAATDLIWERGYNATSMSELTDRMGISRSSIYNTFGGKQELLLASIENYSAAQARELSRILDSGGFRDGLEELVEQVVSSNNRGRGCLLVNCAAELSLHDARAACVIREGLNDLADAMATRARRARDDGEIAADTDPDLLARSLVTFITGLRIMAKSGMDRRTIRAVARESLGALLG